MTINQNAELYLQLTDEIRVLSERRAKVLARMEAQLRRSKRYRDDAVMTTRYTVGSTSVRGYTRSGFTAVRVTRR